MFEAHPREPQILLGDHVRPRAFDDEGYLLMQLYSEVIHGANVQYRGAPQTAATLRAIEASANRTAQFFDAAEGTSFSKTCSFEARYVVGGDVELSFVPRSRGFIDRILSRLFD